MDRSGDVQDPTDWNGTPLSALGQLDSSLRCQICKEFFNTAVITSCSHTFCSICIRRALAADGKCPTCRANEQEVKLRRNVAVSEVVEAFAAARKETLDFARNNAEQRVAQEGKTTRMKRKREDTEGQDGLPAQQSRKLRSQSRKEKERHSDESDASVVALDGPPDSKDDMDDREYVPDDGLVACPICQTRMKQEAVFPHLDTCDGTRRPTPSATASRPKSSSSTPQPSVRPPERPPPERLPQLNYGMLTDTKLRKKLSELGISATGPKNLLIRRHQEWVNLWNSNCDSNRPRPRRELKEELDRWERSQGSHGPGGLDASGAAGRDHYGVMKKDFDGKAWAGQNKDQFEDLIRKAREKRRAATSSSTDAAPSSSIDAAPTSSTDAAQADDTAQQPPAPARHLPDPSENSPRLPQRLVHAPATPSGTENRQARDTNGRPMSAHARAAAPGADAQALAQQASPHAAPMSTSMSMSMSTPAAARSSANPRSSLPPIVTPARALHPASAPPPSPGSASSPTRQPPSIFHTNSLPEDHYQATAADAAQSPTPTSAASAVPLPRRGSAASTASSARGSYSRENSGAGAASSTFPSPGEGVPVPRRRRPSTTSLLEGQPSIPHLPEDMSLSNIGELRTLPMFEMPGEPIVDAEVGDGGR